MVTQVMFDTTIMRSRNETSNPTVVHRYEHRNCKKLGSQSIETLY